MAHSKWDNRTVLHIPESEKDPEMHYRFVRKDNVKRLKEQGYIKCSDVKTSKISEPKREEMVIMQIPKKEAEEKRNYFRGLHQEKVKNDMEVQDEMSRTVLTPQGKRLIK